MNPDVALVTGLFLLMLAIVSALSAYSDGHRPRVALLVMVVAGALIYYAASTQPGGYPLSDVPNAILRVIALVI